DLVARAEAGGDALVGALEEVNRRVVVEVDARLIAGTVVDEVAQVGTAHFGHGETARVGRARTTAHRLVVPHRAVRVVALAVVQRVVLAPGDPADGVTAVTTEAATDDQVGAAADAVETGITRRCLVARLFVEALHFLV